MDWWHLAKKHLVFCNSRKNFFDLLLGVNKRNHILEQGFKAHLYPLGSLSTVLILVFSSPKLLSLHRDPKYRQTLDASTGNTQLKGYV